MKALTFIEPDGTWGIAGMNESNQEQKMYAVTCKLREYERTGLQPDEVERLKDSAIKLIREKLLEKGKILQEKEQNSKDSYQDLLTLKEIGEINTAVKVLNRIFDNPAAGMVEEYNNGWILCSERLPEEDGFYLTTVIFKGKYSTCRHLFDKNNGEWLDSDYIPFVNDDVSAIIAWKPLPEPYKGGEIDE